jgi:hypothetical protein
MKTAIWVVLIAVVLFLGAGVWASYMLSHRMLSKYDDLVVYQEKPLTIENAPKGPFAVEEKLEFSGNGELKTDLFKLNAGVVRAEYSYLGKEWFVVSVADEADEFVSLIVNETGGPQEGSRAFMIDTPGNYSIYVNGVDGDWSVVLY